MGKKNLVTKSLAMVITVALLASLMPAAFVSAATSFKIYSNPQYDNSAYGRSYIWALSPDAAIEGYGGSQSVRAMMFIAGDGIVHEPKAGSLDGYNTTVTVKHKVGEVGDGRFTNDSDLAARITYKEDGVIKKSPALRFTGYHPNAKQNREFGGKGTEVFFNLGTYPNVIDVNIYHILSDPVDSSRVGGNANSQPYHEYVQFDVAGPAGQAAPAQDIYIEKKIFPNNELGVPMATPIPTAQPVTAPGATMYPFVQPNSIVTDSPVVSLGLGTSFSLFPGDNNGIPAAVDNVIENGAPILNSVNGITRYEFQPGGKVNHSIMWGMNNSEVSGAVGNKIIFKPTEGLLKGVVTRVEAYQFITGNDGLDAVIKYDGGKEATVNFFPKGLKPRSFDRADIIEIGEYTDIESVTVVTKGTGGQRIPSIIFTVVNEDPNVPGPDMSRKQYVKPLLEQSLPEVPVTVPVPTVSSPLYINEVLSGNKTGIVDANEVKSDWVEIYNSSDSAIDISGFGLTDNPKSLRKWAFPANTVIQGGEYLLVFASSSKESKIGNEIHASWAVSKDGETIVLTNLNGDILSVMDLPPMEDDQTLARVPDGSSNLKIMTPTPRQSNNGAAAISAFVPKPEFSHGSGFYQTAFPLTISSQAGKVYYTLDGSEPNPENVGKSGLTVTYEFTQPVSVVNPSNNNNIISMIKYGHSENEINNFPTPAKKIDKNMVVRAMAVDDDGNKSETVSKTFFVGYNMSDDFNNAMVISMSGDADLFFDQQYGAFPNYDDQRKEMEVPVHVDIFEKDGKLVIDQKAGARVRGYGSKGMSQKGINLYARDEYGEKRFNYPLFEDAYSFHDGQKIESHKNFALRNGSLNYAGYMFMDGYIQYMGRELGCAYQSQRPATVFINGEYWGLYYMSERVSDDYVENYYGIPKEDVIVIKNHLFKGDAGKKDQDLYNAEKNWLTSTNFEDPANYEQLTAKYDIENLMMFYAANLLPRNRDWLGYNFATWRSRYITDRPYEDGKWRFLMYDLDNVFMDHDIKGYVEKDWGRALMANKSLKKVFANVMFDVANHTFAGQHMYDEFKYWAEEMVPIIVHPKRNNTQFKDKMNDRWNTYVYYVDRISQTYSALTSYENTFLTQMRNAFGLTGYYAYLNVKVNDSQGGKVKINSFVHDFTKGSYTTRNFTDYTSMLEAMPNPGYRFRGWTVSEGTSLSGSDGELLTHVTLAKNGSRVTANFERIPTESHDIATAEDLQWMSEKINSDGEYSNRQYNLTADIDMTGKAYTAAGTQAMPFTGIFEGNGHTINGISITTDNIQGQGLFGYVGNNGIVRGVGVTNINIVSTSEIGKNVGGIAGNNAGLIENCYSTGRIEGFSTVGGIVGNNKGGITRNCYSLAEVTSNSIEEKGSIGGVAGKTELSGQISNSYSSYTPAVAKNDGGFVDTSTGAKTPEQFASGEVAYALNNSGTVKVWGNTSEPAFANDTVKAVNVKVTFIQNGQSNIYRYTYEGGKVALPEGGGNWFYGENGDIPFTAETEVTKSVTVVKEGTTLPTPTPSASPTPSPTTSPTASPTTSPTTSPTVSPTPTPTAPPVTELGQYELFAHPNNPYQVAGIGTRVINPASGPYEKDIRDRNIQIFVGNWGNNKYNYRTNFEGDGVYVSFKPSLEAITKGTTKANFMYFGEYGYAEIVAEVTHAGGVDTITVLDVVAVPDPWGNYYWEYLDKDGNSLVVGDNAMGKDMVLPIGEFTDITEIKLIRNAVPEEAEKKANGDWKLSKLKSISIMGVGFTPVQQPVENGIKITAANGSVEKVTVTNVSDASGKIIVGIYKYIDGIDTLVGIKILDISAADYSSHAADVNVGLAIPEGATSVKAFMWDSEVKIMPVMDSKKLDI